MAKKKTTKKKTGDISKQVYKFQEGITAVALELAGYEPEEIHWPPTGRPEGLTVDVDVLIGKSPEQAHTNISVKHWGGSKNSETAGWRMLRELIDSKVHCNKNVVIINVIFDGEIKGAWEVILASFFDDYLALESGPKWGATLVAKAYEYIRGELFGVEDEKARVILRERAEKNGSKCDPDLATAAHHYSRALAAMVGNKKRGLGSFWDIVRNHACANHPEVPPKTTSLKRGLAKFLIFEKSDREKIYDWFESSGATEIVDLPKYALELNLVEEDIGGNWFIIDDDIIRAFELLPERSKETFELIYDNSPVDRMVEKYINPLRESGNTITFYKYIADHHATLSTPGGMLISLNSCFEDSMGLLDGYEVDGIETSVWLFTALIALFKSAASGTKQSYGLSTLADETGIPEISAGGFLIPPFIYREKPLSKSILSRISSALSSRLSSIGESAIDDLVQSSRSYFVQRIMETQLVPYKSFDPIGILLKKALDEVSKEWVHHQTFRTAANEYAETKAGGTTKVLEIKGGPQRVFVLWQSPNKNARDKAKEFAARCACLIAKYDRDSGTFIPRGVRVFMVIDGIWDQEDIDSLLRFGCENVYYPDEIDQLVRALMPGEAIPIPDTSLPMAAEAPSVDLQQGVKKAK